MGYDPSLILQPRATMPPIAITGDTLDDVMREAVETVLRDGRAVTESTEGANAELLAVTLELTNPRARLSRTEARGKPFSCLGELCWYLGASDLTDQIVYYVSVYGDYDQNGKILGAYGPRLFQSFGTNQLDNVVSMLGKKPSSRQAVIQLFDATDIVFRSSSLPLGRRRDVPCTCMFQFFVRDERLNMVTYMRSNDAWFGLTHDLFCFTMLQEIVARRLGRELGTYTHMVGSLHIYDKHRHRAERLAEEGWQPTTQVMPPMPECDPSASIESLLRAERSIRVSGTVPPAILAGLDDYWLDLIRLLEAYRRRKDGDADAIERIRGQMRSSIYDMYLEKAAKAAA